jgi:hypothetical protein
MIFKITNLCVTSTSKVPEITKISPKKSSRKCQSRKCSDRRTDRQFRHTDRQTDRQIRCRCYSLDYLRSPKYERFGREKFEIF